MILAVDPGIRGCGCALFEERKLIAASYVANPEKTGNTAEAAVSMAHAIRAWADTYWVDEMALEWPRIYATRIRRGLTKEDPNDLLALTAVDSALLMRLRAGKVACYAPPDWKGQMKKEPCHARVADRLSDTEWKVLKAADEEAGSLAHNVWDAVGIGLFHVGRFERKRVIPT